AGRGRHPAARIDTTATSKAGPEACIRRTADTDPLTSMVIRLSIIVPFHRRLAFLTRCLAAINPLPAGSELIIVADGAIDDCRDVAAAHGAHVIPIAGPSGPAVARNLAARIATGDVLVFIDADVIVSRGAL